MWIELFHERILTKKRNQIVNQYEYTENAELKIKVFKEMTEEWLEVVVNCRRGIKHDYDIVEGTMADDTIWDYIEEWERLISLASVLHCENPLKIEEEWIEEYNLEIGDFDITKVDPELVDEIPYPTQMGKVYMRLILSTLQQDEDYVDGLIRVYNDGGF